MIPGLLPALFLLLVSSTVTALTPCAPTSKPIRAWNSWSAYANLVTEDIVLKAADWVAEHLKPLGFDTIVIDGGYYSNLTSGAYLLTPNGLPLPDPTRFPSADSTTGLRALADAVRAKGLKLGAWDIRGVPIDGLSLPIAGAPPGTTLGDAASYTRNCTWDTSVLGTDAPSAAATAWYDSLAHWYLTQHLDFVKIDCMWRGGGAHDQSFDEDVAAFAQSFSTIAPNITISWSPGGGFTPQNASYVSSFGGVYGVAYRVTPDFHDFDGWPRLVKQLDWANEYYSFIGANNTFPDLDMLPLGRQDGPKDGTSHPCLYTHDEQRFLMSLWAIARAPLILGAQLPLDANDTWTLPLISNAAMLGVNGASCGNAPVGVLGGDTQGLAAWGAVVEGDGGTRVFALFNTRDAPAAVEVAVVGGTGLCVTELWEGVKEGVLQGEVLARTLNAHAGGLWTVGPC